MELMQLTGRMQIKRLRRNLKTIGLLQRIERVHLKKGDRKMKKNELSADLINVTPTVVEDNVVEESQMPPKDETVFDWLNYSLIFWRHLAFFNYIVFNNSWSDIY